MRAEPYPTQGLDRLDRDTETLTGEIEIKSRRDGVVPTEFVENFSETHGSHTVWVTGGSTLEKLLITAAGAVRIERTRKKTMG